MRRWIWLLLFACASSLMSQSVPSPATTLPPAGDPKTPVQGTGPQLLARARYRIHPGDVLVLNYRFTPDFNQTVTVQPDGYVALNVVGSIRLADLTLEEAHDRIVQLANARLNEPELNLTLKEFVAPYIVVAGEVSKPGRFELREGTTALQSILMAGGYGENARAGQVVVIRRIDDTYGEVHVLNLAHVHRTKDLERDMALQSGDMVMVPRDRISQVSRVIRLANVGVYLNPLDTILK